MATLTGRALLDEVLESTGATVSELFQEALATRLQAAIDAGITSNLALASVLGANAQILATVPEGEDPLDFLVNEVADAKVVIDETPGEPDFLLTADDAGEIILLTPEDDVVVAEAGSLEGTTIIDQGGIDTLTATMTAAFGTAPTIKDVENITFDWDAFGTATVNAVNITGATTITGTSSKTGFLGNFTVQNAGENDIIAGDGMKGNLVVTAVEDSVVDAGAAKTVTVNGETAEADTVEVNAGATTTTMTVGTTIAFDTAVVNAGAATTTMTVEAENATVIAGDATTTITVQAYDVAVIDAGTATDITLIDDAATDTATLTIGADATVTNTGDTGALEFDIADGVTVDLDAFGAGLTVTGAGDVTVTTSALSTSKVVNEKTDGTLTVETDEAGGAVDVTDVEADLIRLTGAVNNTITAVSGTTFEVTEDLTAGVFDVDTESASDVINVTFKEGQATSTAFTGGAIGDFETVNIVAAAEQAAAPTVIDITFADLIATGNTVNLSGTNDVEITDLDAKVLDATDLDGELIVTDTDAAAANVSIAGAQGDNDVTFNAAAVEAVFVGQDGDDTVDFGTPAADAQLTAVTGGGNDTIIANVGTMNDADGYLSVEASAGDNTVQLSGDTSGDDTNIVLTFGEGTDTLELANGTNLVDSNLTITGLEAIQIDTAASLAAAIVSGQAYTVTGVNGAATDVLTIEGTAGAAGETIDLSELVVTDSVSTGISTIITGNTGDDEIIGSDVIDVITGGTGVDTLTGGAGADEFVFVTGDTGITLATADTIVDFSTAAAQGDTIVMANVGIVVEADGTDTADFAEFLVNAAATFTGGASEDVYVEWNAAGSGDAWLISDDNGDGVVDAADIVLVLSGINTDAEFVIADVV